MDALKPHSQDLATGRQRSYYSIENYKLTDMWRNVHSREDSEKRPGIETSKGAKRPGGEVK